MVEIDLNSAFIHQFVIREATLIIASNFKHSILQKEGEKHGFLTIEKNRPVIDWSIFPEEELDSLYSKVEIR